ncbi:MAG: hypothetical protein RL117_90 [Verrucomicrobiota bacterium]|jgi:hypothetical protein
MRQLLLRYAGAMVLAFFVGSCGSSGDLSRGELGLLPSSPQQGTLFTYYEPKGKAKWQGNWTKPLDMTGVSWNDSRTCTLIDDQFVVMAAHYMRPSEVPVMFHDRSGQPIERYIVQTRSLAPMADVAVGKLNLPVPPSIKRYAFAPISEVKPGRAVLITDQTKTVSVHQIQSYQNRMVSFAFIQDLDPIYRRNLIVGDSGNPTFIISNNDLRLLETHFYGGPGTGPCFANGEIQAGVRAAMDEMR